MTSIQLALIAGAIIATGVAVIIYSLVPATPELRSFLDHLSPSTPTAPAGVSTSPTGASSGTDQIGLWMMRTLPTGWLAPSRADLAILRKPLHQFYGEKVLFGAAGLFLPLVVATFAALAGVMFGFSFPLYLPIGLSLAAAVGLSFIPDYNVRSDAAAARKSFRHALAIYIDLVSMQRRRNAQPRQAMETAAAAADSWVLLRLREVLTRSKLTGDYPWDALTDLGTELDLPDLVEVADIMRLAGDDHAAVYDQLRARSAAMRDALRAEDLSDANSAGVRLWVPTTTLGLIFIMILGVPVILRLLNGL